MCSNTTLLTNVFILENIAVFDENVHVYYIFFLIRFTNAFKNFHFNF